MRTLRLLLTAALLSGALPASAQDDDAPFFSLSTDRTFAPGEKVTVQLNAFRVNRLGFRVYRVKDPVQFFSKLDSPHEFGTRIARPQIGKRSPLERFHTFKVRARRWARNFLRAQFTTNSRSEIRVAMAERSARKVTRKVDSTSFAGVPLLNPERLVTTWEQPVGTPNRWERQVIPVDVREKGLYLVEATDGTLRAYTIALITDLAVLSKSAPGRVFAQVVNRRS
ncbi:MAG TPA: hypothetical protein VN428_09685, partial [Bryobacteraceae bacterium]|nr:hypothetical protein [Bryobacteraceae bacterium]